MIKNIGMCFLLLLTACSYQNKGSQQTTPIDSVAVNPSRLEMQDLTSIPIRSKTVTGEMTTVNSDYIDIAKVLPPTFNNSFGDVQATAVEVKDNKAYIVYNVSGNEVGGAIDIVDIADPSHPSILSTYVSDQYEFSDIVIKDNIIYVSGHQKDTGAILMVISVANNKLEVISVKKINGVYATDLSLYGNTLSVISGSSGGLTEFDVSLNGVPTEISYSELDNGLSVSSNSYFAFYINGNQDTSINSHTKNDFLKLFDNEVSVMPVHSKKVSESRSEAPTRIKLKNSLLYSLNSNAKKLEVIDVSQTGKTKSNLDTISSLSVVGTANGFDLDQQKIFLALGEEGIQIADLKNVKQPSEAGKLLFKNDNGSANNVWARETISGVKYLFIAYGRQGLRIISKKNSSGSDKNIVVTAKGDSSQGENAKFLIKVNGTPAKTFETSEDYEQYVYTHPTALSNNDKVEVIFVNNNNLKNPVSKRNLFVNYVWVADKYCYQDKIVTKNTLNDFGLFESGDAVVYDKGTCKTVQSGTPVCDNKTHVDSFTCVPNERECELPHGKGLQVWNPSTCNSSTCGWSLCETKTCEDGFTLVNGSCIKKICNSQETQQCSVLNGTGVKSCKSNEQEYTECVPTNCNSGYTLVNGVCTVQTCTPNSTTSCTVPNGTGTKTCDAQGLTYGSCVLTSCSAGYKKVNDSCVIDVNYCPTNGASRSCGCSNGSGTQLCQNNQWQTTCTPTTCNSGFTLVNGVCTPQVCTPNSSASCSVTNGSGTKSCSSDGMSYGSCSPTTCNSGYTLVNGVCTVQVCSPNSTTSCPISNGSGTKTCNSTGLAYGSCSPTSCNSGYTLSNGVCTPQVCTPNSTQSCLINNFNGVKTCSSNGLELGSCVSTGSCSTGYALVNGSCVPQICTPNSSTSCPVPNGTGVKSCSSNGTTYGSCTVSSCNAGYYLENGTCKPQLCNPYESASCTDSHGTGIKSCSANGSSWGNCQVTTCDSGYDKKFTPSTTVFSFCSNEYENCVTNANNVTIKYGKNGTYTQDQIMNQQVACSNSVFGDPLVGTVKECLVKGTFSCELRVCKSNEYDNGSACVPQLCTPNSTKSCEVNNFTGTQTCSSNGSSWGSCVSTGSCKAGYTLQNGQCVVQICNPGSSTSCSIQNGTGSKTCSSDGLSYSSCTVTSCNSGCYSSNNSCVVQTCTPNSTQSCLINNFNGTKTCTSNGSAWGSCISTGSCQSGYSLQNGACVPQVCTPNSTTSCAVTNGTGSKTCDSLGLAYGSCTVNSCSVGYKLSNNSCVIDPNYCPTNGSTKTCSSNNGTGTQSCVSNQWSSTCVINSCNSGYTLKNGTCVPQLCTPNSTASCSITNGSGTKSCSSDGMTYGSCTPTTCNAGYVLDAGICKPKVCEAFESKTCQTTNGSGIQVCDSKGLSFGSCQVTSCNSGYDKKFTASTTVYSFCSNEYEDCVTNANNVSVKYGKNGTYTEDKVLSQTFACSNSVFGDPLVGTVKECLVKGTFSCVARVCASNEYDDGTKCVTKVCTPNSTQSCLVNNFTGTQTCTSSGSAWGSCVSSGSCKSGYTLQNGQCVVQSCTPNSTTSCTVSNGTGSKTCDSQGLNYGSCTVNSCNAGYKLSNNSCVIDPNYCPTNGATKSCGCSNGSGVQTCSNNQWSSTCTPKTCNSGYTLVNGSCVSQVCTPNSSLYCVIANGIGSKTCSSTGMSYGSCTAKSCNYGYVLDKGQCVKPVCHH